MAGEATMAAAAPYAKPVKRTGAPSRERLDELRQESHRRAAVVLALLEQIEPATER